MLGELVEKSTRVLTDEERAVLETEFVGRNGERRKIEVNISRKQYTHTHSWLVHYGTTKAQEIASLRNQMARTRSQVEYLAPP